ncbi:hypothetical protein D1007_01108 [Hordeum vulgare]|nr:hypothetical protein D1007_01108 [Hordeum vulgare]
MLSSSWPCYRQARHRPRLLPWPPQPRGRAVVPVHPGLHRARQDLCCELLSLLPNFAPRIRHRGSPSLLVLFAVAPAHAPAPLFSCCCLLGCCCCAAPMPLLRFATGALPAARCSPACHVRLP